MQPEITVVTPSLNQAAFLERCLSSVSDQGLGERLEHLVFDGGSTDGSLAILERWAAGSRGSRRFVSGPDAGTGQAVNRGFAAARGPVLGWLNSDDVYEPGAVEVALRVLRERPGVDVVYGDGSHIDAQGRVLAPYPTADWDYELLKQTCFVCQPAVFLRRSVFHRFGGLDESLRFSEDYEYWLRIGASLRFERVRVRLAATRLHAGAKTVALRLPVHRATCEMLRRRLGYTPLRWLYLTARLEVRARRAAAGRTLWSPGYPAALAAELARASRVARGVRPARDVAHFARWYAARAVRRVVSAR
jgi:glycosyltransferase involved in cell wall biosynthesis